jgi:hypothetical protein
VKGKTVTDEAACQIKRRKAIPRHRDIAMAQVYVLVSIDVLMDRTPWRMIESQ